MAWPAPPCGIFVLGSAKAGFSPAQVLDYPFVDGFVLRMLWTDVEPADGVYDFSAIDEALAAVGAAGQKMSIQIIGEEPPHVVAKAAETWVWYDLNDNHTGDCTDADGCVRSLPWDPAVLDHYGALMSALGSHVVNTAGGPVPLSEHPDLVLLMPPLPGWSRIRELFFDVEDWPGYSRDKLIGSITDAIDLQAGAFPDKALMAGFWSISDGPDSPALWEDISAALLERYTGPGGSRLGFFQENLWHGVDAAGMDQYGPEPDFAEPLFGAKDKTFIPFQMLTSWAAPFTGEDKVAGGSPHQAMTWANATYGTRYFEIYAADAKAAVETNPAWLDGMTAVHETLGCD